MIRNKRELRMKYELLEIVKSALKERKFQCSEEKVDWLIKVYKKEIREYLRRDKEQEDSLLRGTLVKDYGVDGIIEKLVVPFDVSDAELWFENEIRIPYYPSAYDCTGQAFTSWHRIYKQGGRTVIYHRISVDC